MRKIGDIHKQTVGLLQSGAVIWLHNLIDRDIIFGLCHKILHITLASHEG